MVMTMIVLGIETSCDETAAAVVAEDGEVLSSEVASQIEAHRIYGGVVPGVTKAEALDALEAEGRRRARFSRIGHTPGRVDLVPAKPDPDFPFTLDLRRS